jgi:hypothetical protein
MTDPLPEENERGQTYGSFRMDTRRELRISFVVLLRVWREEFRGDFAEGAKKLRQWGEKESGN